MNVSKKKKKPAAPKGEEANQGGSELIKKKKKNLKKKNQKIKKKQAKKMKEMGLSDEQIKTELEKLPLKNLSTIDELENKEYNDEEEKYDLDDLVERPKVQSVPKVTYDSDYEEGTIDFDIADYSKKLQNYARESNKVINDSEYRNELINKKKMLESANDEREKMNILKSAHDKGKKRGPGVDENVKVKIVDLGNACWFHHHFSTEIQTRQYRSPEVILGINYGPSADVWSFAAMIFELVTGDFLFEPRKGDTYSKNDDHLAQVLELLGKMPKKFALSGRYSKVIYINYSYRNTSPSQETSAESKDFSSGR